MPFQIRMVRARHAHKSEHPKTGVWLTGDCPLRTKLTIAERPSLPPSCSRDEVMPPLKSNFPEGAYNRACPEPLTQNRCASRPLMSLIMCMPGKLVAEFHKSPCSQSARTLSGIVKTTVTEILFWVSAMRISSSWRLARVQGQ
jgi:hypothetical protein